MRAHQPTTLPPPAHLVRPGIRVPMNTRLPLATAIALLAAPASLLAQAKVEEVVLGPANGASYSSSVPHLSKTGLHVAVQVSKGSRIAMRVDGVDGPSVDAVAQGFVFSTNGTRHAYVAKVGEEHIVVLDGKEVARARPNRNGTIPFTSLGFSPKGTRFYYQQLMPPDGSPLRWVIDGKPSDIPSYGGSEGPVFSPDETRYFYWLTLPAGTQKLIVDGKDSGFPGQDPQFSPDSKNIITIAHSPTGSTLVINGRPGSRAKKILKAHMSSGGLNLLVLGTGGEAGTPMTQYLGTAGKKIEGSDCQIIESLTFSPDGKRYAALCSNHSRKFMLIDGKKHQDYDGITDFTFSTDSTKTFYVARAAGKSFAVVNDEESEGYPTMQGISSSSLNPLRLGAGGKRIGFLGSAGTRDTFVVVDGKTTTVKNGSFLAFSPDASRYAFAAGDPGFPTLYLDGAEQKDVAVIAPNNMPEGAPFSFSPDGKHVAHFGFINPRNDRRGLVVNGKLVDVFTALYQVPSFTPDGNHMFYYRTVPGAFELCVDGKPAVKFSGIPLHPQQGSKQPLWEMSTEGVYTFLAVVDTMLKRFRVTPSADTSITKMIADVEAAAAKEIADANAAKQKAADDAAALKKKQDDDRAAAAAKAKADADARAKAAADAKAKAKADADARAAAAKAKQKK